MKRKRPLHEPQELEEPSVVKKRKSRSKRTEPDVSIQDEEYEEPVVKEVQRTRNLRKKGKKVLAVSEEDDISIIKTSLQPGPSSSAKRKKKSSSQLGNTINENGTITGDTGILNNSENASGLNKIKKKNGLPRREASESPSDFQPLGQLLKKAEILRNKNLKHEEIKADICEGTKPLKKKQKKGVATMELNTADNENTKETRVQNIMMKDEADNKDPGLRSIQKVSRRKKHLQEAQYEDITKEESLKPNISPKRPKKKVRIDETESLKIKKELADTELHFSVRELPAKIIKSKLNKNMTEEVKVSPLTVQALKKEKKALKNIDIIKPKLQEDELVEEEDESNIIEIKLEDIKNEINDGEHAVNIETSNSEDSDLEVYYINKTAEKEAKKRDKLLLPKKHSILMPKEDQLSLVQRIQDIIPDEDSKSYKYRLQKLEWDKVKHLKAAKGKRVAFKNYSLEECQKVWNQLLKKVRHYRLLVELTHDIKTVIECNDLQVTKPKKTKSVNKKHPDMPKRPLTSYFLYYIRKRDKISKERPDLDTLELNKYISEKYQNLPLDKKQKYEDLAAKNREEYKRQMEEFYGKHPEMRKVIIKKPKEKKQKPPQRPENPYKLFMQSELNREEIAEEDKAEFKEVCREKWRQMSDSKKLGWINLAEERLQKHEEELKEYMALHPEYTVKPQPKPFLSREEVNLKDKLAGKPKRPPGTAYGLFISLTLQGKDIVNIPPKERWLYTSTKWKAMSEDEREQYKQLLAQVHEQYDKDFKIYLNSLPEDKRQEEILRNMPKKRKNATKEKASTSAKSPKASTSKTQPPKRKSVTSNTSAKPKPQNPIAPPRSAFKYFAEKYQGENPKEAWKNLDPVEKEKCEKELSVLKDKYIKEFEAFLKGLSKDELAAFCANRNSQVEEYSSSDESDVESERGDNEESSDESSDSSESDNESDEN